jgi:hypothetical protein
MRPDATKPASRVVARPLDIEIANAAYPDCRDGHEFDGIRSVSEDDTSRPELPKSRADVVNSLADLFEASLETRGDLREP